MTNVFVQSNFERVAGDFYPTIDPRCVYGFLEHFQPVGLSVDVCAPDGSGIVDALKVCGYEAIGLSDAFATIDMRVNWIVTNPPYARGLVDDIINAQIKRLEDKSVYGVAVLLRSGFDFAKSRKAMFEHPNYYGQIKLRFRPWWSENHDKQPIHSYVWQIWQLGNREPKVMYADGKRQ